MAPFVGRRAELSAVEALATRVHVTRKPAAPFFFFFFSDPGQGKSRLIARQAHLAREYGSLGVSPARSDGVAAQQAHLAREYGSQQGAVESVDLGAALRAHLAIEYDGQ